jgi:DNA-binding GntR family transcriptional regulator
MTHIDPPEAVPQTSGVSRCLADIRQMIMTGELLPGQKVHQADLAARLNVSRIPVREALSTLQAEGVLVHKPNTGFTVARFSSEDLSEIYLMRRLLETAFLKSIDLAQVDADELEKINSGLADIEPLASPTDYQAINRRFHFRLFEYSPLELVRTEVARLWYKSEFYRSLHLSEPDTSQHVHSDHERIVAAVRAGDRQELIRASDEHRETTEQIIVRRLGRSRPR